MRMVSQSAILNLQASSILEPWGPSPTHAHVRAQDLIAIPAQGAGVYIGQGICRWESGAGEKGKRRKRGKVEKGKRGKGGNVAKGKKGKGKGWKGCKGYKGYKG